MEETAKKIGGRRKGGGRRAGASKGGSRVEAVTMLPVTDEGTLREAPEENAAQPAEVPAQVSGSAASEEAPREEREAVVAPEIPFEAPAEEASLPEEERRSPGELEELHAELFSEDLDQKAVEQMFRWAREGHSDGETEEGGELSGTALLESVRHGRHVAGLLLRLFEALSSVHQLDGRWARLLVQASLWHDLGFAMGGRKRHHKRSMEIIERNGHLSLGFGLEEKDRPLVALLARYHRRAWPSVKHRPFAALAPEERSALQRAAALLRMADALDFTHRAAVEDLRVRVRRRSATITCFGARSCARECRRTLKKGDLFEKLFGRKLAVTQGKEGDRDER